MTPELAAAMRRVLLDLDIDGMLRLWPQAFPHLPRPANRAEAERTLHVAVTAAESVPARRRLYSHAWLSERNLPSMLPDRLHPPRIAEAVMISVNSKSPEVQVLVEGAMRNVALDAYANKSAPDPLRLRTRMLDARTRERKALGLAGGERA